ncbi:MAG TPA: hypothetical protein VFN88_02775, partial [Caulobacteraceae bacterium]|nr:hypothetical protein [Caulobacteraceae bacterium]
MSRFGQDDFDRTVQALRDAPFVDGAMDEALGLFAEAGGGWSGHMLGVSPTLGLVFNWHAGLSSQAMDEFIAMGGAIPGVNARLAAFFELAPFDVRCDDELVPADERNASPFYQELFPRYDAEYCLAARIPGPGDVKVLIGVNRTSAQGAANDEDKQRLKALLPHLETAIRLQQALEGQGALLAAQSFEALSMAAFLCNAWGRVVGMTPAAERLVASGGPLRLSGGQLTALDAAANVGLQAALRAACGDRAANAALTRETSLALTDAQGSARRVDVAPLPLEGAPMRLGAVAVVAVSDTLPLIRTVELLRRTFGLTRAEAEVAVDVAEGLS